MQRRAATWTSAAVVAGVALTAVFSAQGANRTWGNTAGGPFEGGTNWIGGVVPVAADSAYFTASASYAVTFGTTVTNANAYFSAPGGTVTLDIGAASLYYLTLMRLEHASGAASVDLASGPLSAYKVFVGDQAANNGNRLTVRNSGSILSTRGDDILIGASGSGNLLLVTNGATVVAGRTAYAGTYASSSSNTIVVSGVGSQLAAGKATGLGVIIGNSGDNNRLVLEDGATVVCTNSGFSVGELAGADGNSVFVGSGCLLTNGTAANTSSYVGNNGSYNAMTVSNATLVLDFNLNVGQNGSFNRLDVLDGSRVLPRTHLYIGGTAAAMSNTVVVSGSNSLLRTTGGYDVSSGNIGNFNTLLITNGAEVAAYRTVYVGNTKGSSGNQIIVSGTNSMLRSEGLTATYSIAVGKSGTNNTLRLEDGATFTCANAVTFSVGTDIGTLSNSVDIGSGCMVTNPGSVFVGEGGNDNSLTLSNATLYAGGYSHVGYSGSGNSMTLCAGAKYYYTGHCHVGYNTNAVNNTLIVTGPGTLMTNQNFDLDVGFKGSENRMRIADGAEVTIRRSVFVGHNAGASNNVLEIEGGTLRSPQTYSGGTQTMMVSNACALAVYGSNSVVQAKTLQILGGSRLDVRIGADGFTPLAVQNAVTFDATTRLTVDATGFAQAGGGTVTLMTYGSKSGTIAAENMTLLPEGTTVNQSDANRITLRVPSYKGTLISVR